MENKVYNADYSGNRSSRIAFPLGGMGAGMFCLEGTGALSHFSVRHSPDINNEPMVFSAVCIKRKEGNIARVLEGPVPSWKVFNGRADAFGPGNGLPGKHYGLPRFAESTFRARFPFATVELQDPKLPVKAAINGWSPFIPLNADASSLPVAGLEFIFENISDEPVELVYSFNSAHFMAVPNNAESHHVLRAENGFVLNQPPIEGKPWEQGAFCAVADQPHAKVNCAWFRGGWFDPLTMIWNAIEAGESPEKPPVNEGKPSPGASIFVPLTLQPHEKKTIRIMLSWFVPESNLTIGVPADAKQKEEPASNDAQPFHKPWYAGRFSDIFNVSDYWVRHYDRLREESETFTNCFYDTTLPDEVVEAVAANLTILKSPTVLRQTDGRLWGWEGCHDNRGCCHGTCTHVWNYAQAVPHLFPNLERGLRETESNEGQDENGHQNFRVPLPIQPADHLFHSASDGQLGNIMKVYREWRISGNTEWMVRQWPKVKQSLKFCIDHWDPDRIGVLVEPHHNTYDIEFWGPDGMCSSVYLGALKAAELMARAIEETEDADAYVSLYLKGRQYVETELFNGEYFEQKIVWEGLRAASPVQEQSFHTSYSAEALEILRELGPKYQYGKGCLSDGVIGAWLAEMCGLGDILDRDKVKSHLLSIYKYNLKRDLSDHANPQRPGYAVGSEGGLLLCSWPKGGRLALPFVYSNEVWTGIEYQVASHLLAVGCISEGLDIVRVCRDRYEGRVRNPFNEYECGHWYARAMASYALIQGWSGIRYDACNKTMYISPSASGDFRSFLCTAFGYGIAGIRDGKPFVDVKAGNIPIDHIHLT